MKKLLMMGLVSMLLPISSGARNVYAYKTGNYSPVFTSLSVQKIVFGASGLEVYTKYGKPSVVDFADFDYFRFYKTPVPVGLESISEDGLSIMFDGNNIRVESNAPVAAVSVYSVQGMLMVQKRPGTKSVVLPASSYMPGIYFVKVASDGKETVKKIIK